MLKQSLEHTGVGLATVYTCTDCGESNPVVAEEIDHDVDCSFT